MGTKNRPAANDCYAKAEGDEPLFVLLGRDPSAGYIVRMWAMARRNAVLAGQKPESDLALVDEAMQCAAAMDTWHKEHRGR